MKSFKTVQQVVDWRLCLGCGVCAYICPERKIRLVDFVEEGIRPVVDTEECGSCRLCLEVCPSYENDHEAINAAPGLIDAVKPYCGPVLEIWEGHAMDPKIRLAGSSGGLITALSLYCLEQETMHGVLHIGQDPADPLRNKTTMSRTREEMMGKSGSRYAPASACDRLDLIESAPAPCVFVGQPTEVSALQKARAMKPALDQKVGVTLSFFCAGSPARKSTVELLKSMGVDPSQVQDLRYRGNGWPGQFAVTMKGQSSPSHFRTYKESWGFIQAYRSFSVHLCPDGTGEDADISCGDPWYREVKPGEPGSSLVVVRTERGRRILQGAIAAGYVDLQPAEPWKLLRSQEGLFEKRGAIWGRIATLHALGLPAPKLKGFSLFHNWRRLSFEDKLRSTFGTVRRIVQRKYFKPLRLDPATESLRSEAGAEKPRLDLHAGSELPGGDAVVGEDCAIQLRQKPSVLVAIVSYGTAQDHYLHRVVAEYRNLRLPVRVVVLTNQPKPVEGAEVVVGLPTRDPYSLPFAHKKVLADHVNDHDLFIYSEDDVLITEKQIEAFLQAQAKLEENEIPGFIRSETSPDGAQFITSINHHFRWRPDSVVERGGELFADLSNQHSGCFMVTQKQLRKAIASRGFLVAPHAEKYGMLETAASDLYTQCGLRRRLALSRIQEFTVPHLPNKYYTRMGIPMEGLQEQVRVLGEIYRQQGWSGTLVEPESRMPGFGFSKNLYGPVDEQLVQELPASAKSVLSVGCGSGENEVWLARKGFKVCAVPIDAVFGGWLRKRGIRTVEGTLDQAIAALGAERFDLVLLPDVLQLVVNPVDWLLRLGGLLAPKGTLRASVPSTTELFAWIRDCRQGRRRSRVPSYDRNGVHPVSPSGLREWCRAASLTAVTIQPVVPDRRHAMRRWGLGVLDAALAERFILTAGRGNEIES